jgi:DNA mismatch repair protein MutS2
MSLSPLSIQTETLNLLEWGRLCQHLATFAATKLAVLAARQLVIPQTIAASQELLDQTREISELEQQLGTSLTFDGITDIATPLQRATVQGLLNGTELYAIASTLAGMRKLRRAIDSSENIPTLTELVANIRTYPELEQEIYHCIDDHGDVTDRASENLRLVRIQLKVTRDKIQKMLQNVLQRHSNAIHQPIITQRSDRFVIQVKASHKDAVPGIVHDVSASGSTLYIEPSGVVNLGNQLRQQQRQEQREVEIVCRLLSDKVAEVREDLELLLAAATAIDLATARYRYSNWLGANPPRLIGTAESQQITLRNLRHPLLVWQEQHEQGRLVVPTDLVIQPQTRVVTITGPNTGGKTVTLKTLAIAALMAKVGLYVPAKEPVEIPWFEQILADIGDEQSLQQSLSTFSGHIRRIGRILAEMNPGSSLILLDEVGAGTDPAEGSALATALLRHLADRAYLTIATTHYGELKALKYEDERFENASVEFDDVSLSPTYRLLWGIPGRSNALAIARRLGLNEEVIVAAEQQVTAAGGSEVNEIIAGLEAQRRRQEEKAQAAQELLQQAEAFYQEVSRKANELQAREQQLKIAQEQSIQAELATAKAEIAGIIKQLQQGKTTAQAAQQATAELNRIAQERSAPPPPPPIGYQPRVGERIRVPRLGQTAEVLTAADDRGNLQVRLGLMSVSVALTDVESLTGEKPKVPTKPAKQFVPPPAAKPDKKDILIRTDKNTVDVRGQRVDAAVIEVDRAMNAAHASGVLWVIHGKGTGKLREGLHEFLNSHAQVTKVELASQPDGGAGVSIVYLR